MPAKSNVGEELCLILADKRLLELRLDVVVGAVNSATRKPVAPVQSRVPNLILLSSLLSILGLQQKLFPN
jgi:hypothetical protein